MDRGLQNNKNGTSSKYYNSFRQTLKVQIFGAIFALDSKSGSKYGQVQVELYRFNNYCFSQLGSNDQNQWRLWGFCILWAPRNDSG